jgi:hypothetical protein
MLTETMCPPIV